MNYKETDIGNISTLSNINSKEHFFHGGKRLHPNYKDKKPLISIITVVKNGEKFIDETFKSIFNQKFKNFELIVIDGGSTDETLNKIKKNDEQIDYWISENDEGIYDAFNKGLVLAKGDLIGFVNSDDMLTDEALSLLDKYNKFFPSADFIFGSVKKHWGVLHGYKPWKRYWRRGFYSSHSTGFYIKKEAARKNGFYNLKYKYSADYDYFFRMIVKKKLKGVASKKEELFGIFRRGGYSSKISFFDHFIEEINIRLDNGQNKILVLLIFIYKYLKNLNKF